MRQRNSSNVVPLISPPSLVLPLPSLDPAAKLMMTDQAAEVIGLKPSTLEKLRSVGGGPAYHKLGRSVRYAQADLQAWVHARRRVHTGQAKAE